MGMTVTHAPPAYFSRFSHSLISDVLDNCAYKAYLERIVGLPRETNGRLAVGSAYHAAIEAHEHERRVYHMTRGAKGNPEGVDQGTAADRGLDSLKHAGVDWEADDMSGDDACDMLLAAIGHWYETTIPEGQPGAGGSLRDRVLQWRPVSVEVFWKLWMPAQTSIPVVGAADCVYLTGDDRLVVVDHKSANSFSSWKHDGDGKRDQAAMYVLAAMRSPLLPATRGDLPEFEYHIARTKAGKNANFEGVRCIAIDVDRVDLDFVKTRIGLAHDRMLDGNFPKNPDSWLCSPRWCSFHIEAGGPCDPHAPPEQ